MPASPRKLHILITGCSPGGTGAALAVALHARGHHVYATARNIAKLTALAAQGIKIFALDISSSASIATAVEEVTAMLPADRGLDMLVNNAAGSYSMPIADVDLVAARDIFETNVWGSLAVTQGFLALLLKAATTGNGSQSPGQGQWQPTIVNHTSVGSVNAVPFQGIYNASKAALAMLSATMAMELAPFGIRVVDLKTAGVKTNIVANNNMNRHRYSQGGTGTVTGNDAGVGKDATSSNLAVDRLPADSIYAPAREVMMIILAQEELTKDITCTPEQWADGVTKKLLDRRNPPAEIWEGQSAGLVRIITMLPKWIWANYVVRKMTKLDVVEGIIRAHRK